MIIRINTSGVITGMGIAANGVFVNLYADQDNSELPLLIPTSDYGISIDINENIYIEQSGNVWYNDSSYDSDYVRGKVKQIGYASISYNDSSYDSSYVRGKPKSV